MALLALLLSGGLWTRLERVRSYNQSLQQAHLAYTHGRFGEAAAWYEKALQLGGSTDQLQVNLGHAYARLGNSPKARQAYGRLLQSPALQVRSVARQQLAVLAAERGDMAQASALLRQALLDDPTNAGARYDYEVIRRYQGRPNDPQKLPSRQPQASQPGAGQQQPQVGASSSAPTAGQSDLENPPPRQGSGNAQRTAQGDASGGTRGTGSEPDASQDGSGRPGTESATLNDARLNTRRQQLQQLNLTEAQARQLLDALRANEQQYLQQLPHKATKRAEPGKPTW
ncbi:tetratricopeptide repeat protein [Hymenobacter busanensis]|nr:tetratricopeptide repeat protein [Hymenobacter busanensis]